MAYKVGFCPQCDTQIMVRDIRGKWNSFKPNYRQAYLSFPNGMKVKTIICEECLKNPDNDKIIEAITNKNSEACNGETKERIKDFGKPESVTAYSNKVVSER